MIYEYHKLLIEYLIEEVLASGGDGDVTVHCRSGNAHEMGEALLQRINEKYPNYPLQGHPGEDSYTIAGHNQESWYFTNHPTNHEGNSCLVSCH